VVSVDKEFVTFLNDRDQIIIVHSTDLISRQPCDPSGSLLSTTFITFIFGDSGKTKAKCPERPKN
jgi:hypothetical protein